MQSDYNNLLLWYVQHSTQLSSNLDLLDASLFWQNWYTAAAFKLPVYAHIPAGKLVMF